METPAPPVVKDLVLIGGGHSHVTVLKSFGMRPLPGVRLTLISKDVHTPYSGMLPGFIAGHYNFDEVHIDLGPLARFAGARLVHDTVVGIDPASQRILCRARPPMSYDVLSINTGSTPRMNHVRGASGSVVPVKPIHAFVERWQALQSRVRAHEGALHIAVVGAGAGGVELVLAVDYSLRRDLAQLGRADDAPRLSLFSASSDILPTHNARVRRRFRNVLEKRGIDVHLSTRIQAVESPHLIAEDGARYAADEILWVTDASAAPWLAESGLSCDAKGFVQVEPTLRTLSHADIFAAGDVATVVEHPREKAGVFAVRQGPPLDKNLRHALLGEPLVPFVPQREFLSLLSTGDRYAVASRGAWSFSGRAVWKWKDSIDRTFMTKFNVLPEMRATPPELPAGLNSPETTRALSTAAMRCGGCGAKLGATVLERVLGRLGTATPPGIVVGLDSPDDAAVTEIPSGRVLVQTVDCFPELVSDPYVFGQIAANHSLGDIFAMGADPMSALAIVTLPPGVESKQEELLEQLLRGALDVLSQAGATLVGGHTSEGKELTLGFAVSGHAERGALLRKNGLQPGQQLVLTKSLGTGTLFAADMRLQAKGRWIAGAITNMLLSARKAASCLVRYGATAATDVTGFGLAGHLVEMTKASGVDARLYLTEVPLLDGAIETAKAGIFSSLQPENNRVRRAIRNDEALAKEDVYPLLFDPQTAGGLLAGIPAERASACVAELRELGYPQTAIIGEITPRSEHAEPLTVESARRSKESEHVG